MEVHADRWTNCVHSDNHCMMYPFLIGARLRNGRNKRLPDLDIVRIEWEGKMKRQPQAVAVRKTVEVYENKAGRSAAWTLKGK